MVIRKNVYARLMNDLNDLNKRKLTAKSISNLLKTILKYKGKKDIEFIHKFLRAAVRESDISKNKKTKLYKLFDVSELAGGKKSQEEIVEDAWAKRVRKIVKKENKKVNKKINKLKKDQITLDSKMQSNNINPGFVKSELNKVNQKIDKVSSSAPVLQLALQNKVEQEVNKALNRLDVPEIKKKSSKLTKAYKSLEIASDKWTKSLQTPIKQM